jgi:hypothetical protein
MAQPTNSTSADVPINASANSGIYTSLTGTTEFPLIARIVVNGWRAAPRNLSPLEIYRDGVPLLEEGKDRYDSAYAVLCVWT